jgi:Flp pilus assembly protein TadG
MVEFALICVPLLFCIISVLEIARGMWHYHTIQFATKATGAYISVHGSTCNIPPNSCVIKVNDIVRAFQDAATGIQASDVKLTLTTQSGAVTTCQTLGGCSTNNTIWPPNSPSQSPDNVAGKQFTVRAEYTFRTALSMVSRGKVAFGAFRFAGVSRQLIVF